MPDTARWIDSTPVENGRLTPAQITSWRTSGAALVHDLLPQDLLRQAEADARHLYPSPGTTEAAGFTGFGSDQHFVFPSERSNACNAITLHPALLTAVADLLGVPVEALRLTQSDLWPKYGRAPAADDFDNADQRMHCDYPNHTLTHPPPWDAPEAVEVIVYLCDVADCGGATAVVPRQGPDDPAYAWPIVGTPGVAGLHYVNDRARAEAYLAEHAPDVARFRAQHLYPREALARYRFGSVLLYRHDTWHRGTPLIEGTLRLVHNLTFRKAGADWVNVLHPGWSWSMYRRSQFLEKLIATATVEQRCVLGFPAPGNPYWTEATLTAVEARYAAHGMDMSPYRAAPV
jgi:hypothetical protein